MSTMREIKAQLGVEALGLSYQKDDKGNRAIDETTKKPTLWLRNWDNTNRVATVIHEDTLKKVQANPDMANLAIKVHPTPKTGKQGEYKLQTIIAYTEDDFVV